MLVVLAGTRVVFPRYHELSHQLNSGLIMGRYRLRQLYPIPVRGYRLMRQERHRLRVQYLSVQGRLFDQKKGLMGAWSRAEVTLRDHGQFSPTHGRGYCASNGFKEYFCSLISCFKHIDMRLGMITH